MSLSRKLKANEYTEARYVGPAKRVIVGHRTMNNGEWHKVPQDLAVNLSRQKIYEVRISREKAESLAEEPAEEILDTPEDEVDAPELLDEDL